MKALGSSTGLCCPRLTIDQHSIQYISINTWLSVERVSTVVLLQCQSSIDWGLDRGATNWYWFTEDAFGKPDPYFSNLFFNINAEKLFLGMFNKVHVCLLFGMGTKVWNTISSKTNQKEIKGDKQVPMFLVWIGLTAKLN